MNSSDELTHALADLAASADGHQPPDRLNRIHQRARRTARAHAAAAAMAAAVLVVGGGSLITHARNSGGPLQPAARANTGTPAPTPTLSSPAPTPGPNTATPSPQGSSTSSRAARCLTSGLAVRLSPQGAAAGSTYQAIVFTNTGVGTCSLFGYPGVAFVAPSTGRQVGAPAARDPQHAPVLITLRPGASASALVQVTDPLNYPASSCRLVAVSGLRVYPPGSTVAAYVPFPTSTQACSSAVVQLSVRATLAGTTGQ